MRKEFLSLLVLFVVLFSYPALAVQKLSLKTYGYLVKTVIDEDRQKKEKVVPLPESVYPGDVIEYRIVAKNISNETLKNVVIKTKIPEATTYVPESATKTPEPEFSIDYGKSFQKEPVKYKVYEKGEPVEKTATPDMYTNIRWKVSSIEPQKFRVFKYRVKIAKEKTFQINKSRD